MQRKVKKIDRRGISEREREDKVKHGDQRQKGEQEMREMKMRRREERSKREKSSKTCGGGEEK
jgi:hypothetical protein